MDKPLQPVSAWETKASQCRGLGPCSRRSSREDTGKLDSLSIHLCQRDAVTNQGESICIENGKVDGSGLEKSVPGDPEWHAVVPGTATRIPQPTHPSPLPPQEQKAERRAGRILSDPASSPLVEKTKLSAQKDSVLLPLGAAAGQVQGSRRLGLEPGPAA